MSLETDFFFSEVPYFDQIADGTAIRSLNYEQQRPSMQTINLGEKKSNTGSIKNEDEKSQQKLDYSNIMSQNQKSLNQNQSRLIAFKPKQYKSLLPQVMNKKIKSGKSQVTVYFFDSKKRIIFTKNQLNKIFAIDSKLESTNKQLPTVKNLIPFLVKHYCKLFLNFQPLQVDHESFQVKLANMENLQDKNVDPIDHQQEIIWLFQCGNLVLVRKQRSRQKIMEWQNSLSRLGYTQMEAIQIITPMRRRQLVQQFQKNKNVKSLREKILSYNQLGKIIIVTYSSFKICEPRKKISDIVAIDRVLQVYREKVTTFEDIQIYKKSKLDNQQQIRTFKEDNQEKAPLEADFQVNQSTFSGNLRLQINGTQITQIYEGGILGIIYKRVRKVQRSIYTLIGLSCSKNCKKNGIKLKFISIHGEEVCNYEFNSLHQRDVFFKTILKLGRQLKQNFEKI